MRIHTIVRGLALTLFMGGASLAAAQTPSMTGLPVGALPEFHATTLGGAAFDLATERGRWILVNFGASWCAPCVDSLPPLAAFQAAHSDITVIAANVIDTQPKASAYLQRYGSPSAAVWLTTAETEPLHLAAIPVTWLIAPDGKLVGAWAGTFNRANRAKVEQALHAAGHAGTKAP